MNSRRPHSVSRPGLHSVPRPVSRPVSRPASLTALAACLAVGAVAAVGLLSAPAAAQEPEFKARGDVDGDVLGWSVAGAGDQDGDGVPDVIAGAPRAAEPSPSAPGSARLYSGADGHVLRTFTGRAAGDLFGLSVAGAGDVDGDGRDDVVVGAPGSAAALPSRVLVFSGATGGPLLDLPGSAVAWDGLGTAVDGAGLVDGDARADLIVGAPEAAGGAGEARLLSGAGGGTLFTFAGLLPGDRFGAAVAGAGDVDDDGVPDVIVGGGGNYARVFSGADGSLLHHFPGPAATGDFGSVVAAAGDIDGDGFGDLAIGAPFLGRVDVLSGQSGLLLRRFERTAAGFARALDQVGDLDGDAVPDFAVGAPQDTLDASFGLGSLYLISGATGVTLFKFFPEDATAAFGSSVAGTGDLDGDGRSEVAAGAPFAPGGTARGTLTVYGGKFAGSILPYGLGCPGTFLITPRLELIGNPVPHGHLRLTVSRGPPDVAAAILFGLAQGDAPLSNGCILWLAPLLPQAIVVTLAGTFPGSGTAILEGDLPAPIPPGTVVTMQAFVDDDGADGGFTSTAAVQLTTL